MSPERKSEVDLRRCCRHFENGHDVITRPRMSQCRWNLVPYAESYADDDENVKMETGSRISIWRPFVL